MALLDEAALKRWEERVASGDWQDYRILNDEMRDLCATIRAAWEAVEELRATLALTQAAKRAWEDAANVEMRAHTLLRREALRSQDHAKQLRHALGVMLANAGRDHWIGRAAWWDECQAVYDRAEEVGDTP